MTEGDSSYGGDPGAGTAGKGGEGSRQAQSGAAGQGRWQGSGELLGLSVFSGREKGKQDTEDLHKF